MYSVCLEVKEKKSRSESHFHLPHLSVAITA